MADRTSARVFGMCFELLAEDPTAAHRTMARRLWDMTPEYDFAPYQMGCDDALQVLELARKRVDPDEPDEGEVWFYGPPGADRR